MARRGSRADGTNPRALGTNPRSLSKVEAKIAYLRSLPYDEYLRTRHWHETRARALERWKGKCENCGTAPATQVHHRTYERLGRELLSDLQPLCLACHQAEHQRIFKRREQKRRAVPNRSKFTRR